VQVQVLSSAPATSRTGPITATSRAS